MTDFHKEVLANGHSAIDDRADQLNRYYAIVFIIACVIFLTTKNIVGKQIFCFTPQRFTSLQVILVILRSSARMDLPKLLIVRPKPILKGSSGITMRPNE